MNFLYINKENYKLIRINFTSIDDNNFFLKDNLTKSYFKSIRSYEGGFSMEKGGESQGKLIK